MKKLFNLENFIYISIVSIPLYLVKFSFLSLPTNVFEIMAIIGIIWFVIARQGSEIELSGYKKYFIPIVMLVAGLVASALAGEVYATGFGIIKSWFIIPLLFSFVGAEVLRTNKNKNIFTAIYASAFLVSVIAGVYFFLEKLTYDGRLQAIYNSPNFLAMFLVPAAIIGVLKFAENRRYYIFSLAIILFSLYFTFSYAAWLSILMTMMAVFFLRNKTRKNYNKSWLIALIVLSFIFLQSGTSKMRDLVQMSERSSLNSRMMIWKAAGKIIADNPVLGIGAGNFQNKYLEYQKYFPPYLEWAVPEPHNLFLALWLQAGLLGLIGFVWLLILLGKEVWRRKKEGSVEMIIGSSIIFSMLVHGLFDTTYFKNDLAVIFWLSFFSVIKKRSKNGLEKRS